MTLLQDDKPENPELNGKLLKSVKEYSSVNYRGRKSSDGYKRQASNASPSPFSKAGTLRGPMAVVSYLYDYILDHRGGSLAPN